MVEMRFGNRTGIHVGTLDMTFGAILLICILALPRMLRAWAEVEKAKALRRWSERCDPKGVFIVPSAGYDSARRSSNQQSMGVGGRK